MSDRTTPITRRQEIALVTLGIGCGMLMCVAHDNAMQRLRPGRHFVFE